MSDSEATQLEEVLRFIDACTEAGLTISIDKFHPFVRSAKWNGLIFEAGGQYRPDPDRFQTLIDWPDLAEPAEGSRFLHMAGYWRRFIPLFARRTTNLRRAMATPPPSLDLLNKEFRDIRQALLQHTKLTVFDPTRPLEIHTDWAEGGVGAVITQDRHLVAVWGRALRSWPSPSGT
ncbi:MAG: uncharacterized protein KVP18_004199 [Porospora cf. gigantea A]|uniref:uncharacterized protein n=1 Tax=Porospora cf. gigantea A TaxID=2853593 RepID=UPI00355A7A96|nr:MAG: hypothetical protein KVP18_004199 [Porospora cf. gigantea A]